MDGVEWSALTRRTNSPKLNYLMVQLLQESIPFRCCRKSVHAPILEVPKQSMREALALLSPVDDLPDDDHKFAHYEHILTNRIRV